MSLRKLPEGYYGFQPIVDIIINLKFSVLPLMARSERTSNFSISRGRSTNHPFVGNHSLAKTWDSRDKQILLCSLSTLGNSDSDMF